MVAALAAVLLASACSSEPSLGDYAADVESLVTTMNARLDEIDAEVVGSTDLELIRWYATERVAAREAFIEGLDALQPPAGVAELHTTALGIVSRLAAAESALADRVMALETFPGIDAIWATPEGVAARAADAEAIALCEAAEAELDESDQAQLGGAPWVPAEMKHIIEVAFGCQAAER